MNLLLVEMRRALHRRSVRVLILLAILGCVIAGAIAFGSSSGKTIAEIQRHGDTHPAVLTDWWVSGSADGQLGIAFFFLLLGGLFGGATVAGAEWRYGTVTTVLTWQPRRLHLHFARTASAGILAFVIAFLIQVAFLASFIPAVLANGTTAGADADWWLVLFVAIARVSMLTAVAAVLAVALATLGRNTAFALIAVFAWVAVVEGVARGLEPSLKALLWVENLATVFTWAQLKGENVPRSPTLALATLLIYLGVVVAVAAATFQRRDIAAAT
jgi:ABC-2 type transport system permease protein